MSEQMRDDNKRNVRRLFETFNTADLASIDALVGPEYVGAQGDKGPAGFKTVVVGLRAAFPDLHYTLDDVIAEGDQVAVRWHWTGTHQGAFRGFPPTGKSVTNTGAGIFRLSGAQSSPPSWRRTDLGSSSRSARFRRARDAAPAHPPSGAPDRFSCRQGAAATGTSRGGAGSDGRSCTGCRTPSRSAR